MPRKRLILTVGGTAFCALAAGYFMQSGSHGVAPVAATPVPSAVQQAVVAPVVEPVVSRNATLDLTGITTVSAKPDMRVPDPMSAPELEDTGTRREAALGGGLPVAPKDPTPPQLGCEVTVTAVPARLASVDLDVSAPCFANERVTVHHSGMMFTDVTDADGAFSATIPALSEKAVFIVAFANGKGGVATARVPELRDVDRIALQWTGRSGFELHALEFGASYDDAGHVWIGSAEGIAAGSVVRLGDPGALAPQMVEIYTFPSAQAPKSGTVSISVETEVTEDNCGRDISAQSLDIRAGAKLRTRDLVLSMPNCASIGDFLVLNNLIDDLKIAGN